MIDDKGPAVVFGCGVREVPVSGRPAQLMLVGVAIGVVFDIVEVAFQHRPDATAGPLAEPELR